MAHVYIYTFVLEYNVWYEKVKDLMNMHPVHPATIPLSGVTGWPARRSGEC